MSYYTSFPKKNQVFAHAKQEKACINNLFCFGFLSGFLKNTFPQHEGLFNFSANKKPATCPCWQQELQTKPAFCGLQMAVNIFMVNFGNFFKRLYF